MLGPLDIECIKRRNPWTRLAELQPWIGKIQPGRRGPDGESQKQSLVCSPVVLRRQVGRAAVIERGADIIEQQRILPLLLRKDPLGETRHEHHVEPAAPCLLGTTDKDPTVSAGGGILVERCETARQHVADLGERHWTDAGHRSKLAQYSEHALRLLENHRSQSLERV